MPLELRYNSFATLYPRSAAADFLPWLTNFMGFYAAGVLFASGIARAAPTEFETRIRRSIAQVLPSVLKVTGDSNKGPSFGAGFVVDGQMGEIITNYHVVSQVKSVYVESRDGTQPVPCDLIFHDATRDLALLRAKKVEHLPAALSVLNSSELSVGEFVIAVGSPGGYDFSASVGIVSALDRQLPDLNSKLRFIQVDAPMYHGSSGGPLVNLDGDVVGVNSRGGAQGAAAFSIPANDLMQFLQEAHNKSKAESASQFGYLGAALQPLTAGLKSHLGVTAAAGVVVVDMYDGSPAFKAGLMTGDVLLSIGSTLLNAAEEEEMPLIENYIASKGPGEHDLKLVRGKKEISLKAKLSNVPLCDAHSVEQDKVSVLIHSHSGCYWLPQKDFVEVTRFWGLKSGAEALRVGDLIVKVDGSDKDLPISVANILAARDTQSHLLTVLRKGQPRLVLVKLGA